MLVRFSSTKTGSITMFGDTASQLIGMLGASGAIPGAIGAEDLPAAIRRLRQALQAQAESSDAPSHAEGEEHREPQVALATRAVPLLDLLERAKDAKVPVMWEVA